MDESLGLLGTLGLIILAFVVVRQQSRLGLLERELKALRSFILTMPAAAPVGASADEVQPAAAPDAPPIPGDRDAAPSLDGIEAASEAEALPAVASSDEPSSPGIAAAETQIPAGAIATPTGRSVETALGTRWAVWVGGLALALGGVFLVRYTIEAGFFGPGARVVLALLFGAALVAGGETIRRGGFRLPVDGPAGAHIPAILTAAGGFSLFGAIYAAHGLYGFIGPSIAFPLLGAVGVGMVVLALLHGQALAGIGLLGAFATPVLVSSQAPSPWTLFVYLAIVLAAAVAVARVRTWRLLASAAFAGMGLWTLLYLTDASVEIALLAFVTAVSLGVLAFVWSAPALPGPWSSVTRSAWPAAVPALFVAITALAMLLDDTLNLAGGGYAAALILTGMVAVAAWRADSLALLYGAGIAACLAALRVMLAGSLGLEVAGVEVAIAGLPPLANVWGVTWPLLAFALALLAIGAWRARTLVAAEPLRAASFAGFGSLVPPVALAAAWIGGGSLDVDWGFAAPGFVLVITLAAAAEWIAAAERPERAGGVAVSLALACSGLAFLMAVTAGFGPGLTTVIVAAAAVAPAAALGVRSYPALGWLSVAALVVTIGRVALDPTIVGSDALGTTPVFNWLLPGYGIPAAAFAAAAMLLRRHGQMRPRLAMEAGACLFFLLAAAMLVRHAMNGGVIDGGAPSLAEQAIYTLIALGAGAILIVLDLKSPSPVLRWGSIGIGVVSVACIWLQHFLVLNPLLTDEPTGSIPVFNLLLLAYLLPAAAAAALALFARGRRPDWYAAMLAATAAALTFAYATLSLRRLFQGENIGWWAGFGQLETWSYSALWLLLGVGVLVTGVRTGSYTVRVASALLISLAVAKVFLFDMSELQGMLRALSFIGLGAVLIGIGLFYQRLLRGASRAAS